MQIAAWKEFSWLRAGFSTRQGGESVAYAGGGPGEQNLGWTDSDPHETVAANRKHFVATVVGDAPLELVTIRQTHSAQICRIDAGHGVLATPEGKAVLQGDGLITGLPGLLLGIQTADCVPVLVADTRQRVVAAFHAGWRGTVQRIVEQGVNDLRHHYSSHPQDLIAAIGPCISACCFAVGDEVRSQFESQFSYGHELFTGSEALDTVTGKPQIRLDLVEANRRQLLEAGVPAAQVAAVGECTACTRLEDGRRKYFSHRDEHGFTGRMLSVIGVTGG